MKALVVLILIPEFLYRYIRMEICALKAWFWIGMGYLAVVMMHLQGRDTTQQRAMLRELINYFTR